MSKKIIAGAVVWVVGAIVLNTCGSKPENKHIEASTAATEASIEENKTIMHQESKKGKYLLSMQEQNLSSSSKKEPSETESNLTMHEQNSTHAIIVQVEEVSADKAWREQAQKIKNLEDKIKKLSLSNTALVMRSKELEDSKTDLISQKIEQEELVESLTKDFSACSLELDTTKSSLLDQKSKYKKISNEMLSWTNKYAKLEHDSAEINSSSSKLQDAISKLESELSAAKESLSDKKDELLEAKNKLTELSKKNDKLQIASAAQAGMEQKLADITRQKSNLGKKLTELNSVNIALQEEIKNLKKSSLSAKEMSKKQNHELLTLKKRLQEAADKNTQLSSAMSKAGTQLKNVQKADMEKLSVLEQKIQHLNVKNSELAKLYKTEQNSAKNAISKLALLDALQQKFDKQATQVELMKKQDKQSLEAQKAATQKSEEARKALEKELESLKISLEEKEKDFKQKLSVAMGEMQAKEEQSKSIQDRLGQYKVVVDTTKEELENTRKKLEQSSQAYKKQLSLLENQNQNLEQKSKELSEQMSKLKSEVKAKEELLGAFELVHVEFKTGSPELLEESKALLNKAANVMKKYPNFRYEIQGHTDSTGQESKNKELSQKRAQSVKDYLAKSGVDESILIAKGFGSSQPIASNKTRAGKLQNRRVVFRVIKP